jgi:hypothetical protein
MVATRSARFIEERLRSGGGETWVTSSGWSMAPALRPGDRLRVLPFGGAAPTPGEIVLARIGPRLVAHRLVGRGGGSVRTRGDACMHEDPTVGEQALLGRVVEVRRGPRRLPLPRAPHPLAVALRVIAGRMRAALRTLGAVSP